MGWGPVWWQKLPKQRAVAGENTADGQGRIPAAEAGRRGLGSRGPGLRVEANVEFMQMVNGGKSR